MNKAEVCGLIQEIGIIPAIRVSSAEDAHFAADSVTNGGIPIVEITTTVPEAVRLIAHLVRHHPKLVVGAGTVVVISTIGMPPLVTESAAKCASSAEETLIAGIMPIS